MSGLLEGQAVYMAYGYDVVPYTYVSQHSPDYYTVRGRSNRGWFVTVSNRGWFVTVEVRKDLTCVSLEEAKLLLALLNVVRADATHD